MPEYTIPHGIAYPLPGDRIKDTGVVAKLADDIRATAETMNAAIAAEGQRVEQIARDLQWDSSSNLSAENFVASLPSGLHKVSSASVSAALGLPGGGAGSLWVHRLDAAGTMIRREWRPTGSLDVWQQRVHGSTQTQWTLLNWGQFTALDGTQPISDLVSGLYNIRSASVSAALGLPGGGAGSLWVHRLDAAGTMIRREWRPTGSLDVWQQRVHGSTQTQWTRTYPIPGGGGSHGPGDPGPGEEIEDVTLELSATDYDDFPYAVGVDGWVYGSNRVHSVLTRSADSYETPPEQGPTATEIAGPDHGIRYATRTSEGFVVIMRSDALNYSIWFSNDFQGPYAKVLDMGPWHFTTLAKPVIIEGKTWMLVGEYTNAHLPSWPLRRWLSTDGGETWTMIRETPLLDDTVNSHCHTALIRPDGRIYVSDGDGPNNWFGYSDDRGKTWIRVETDPTIQQDAPYTSQPTTLIDFGATIGLSPDRGPYTPGMWSMRADNHQMQIMYELSKGGPYSSAANQYGRSVFAQVGTQGREAYVMMADAGSRNDTTYIVATPDGGNSWGIVAEVGTAGDGVALNAGVVGPDHRGNIFLRGRNLSDYGNNIIRAPLIDWREI